MTLQLTMNNRLDVTNIIGGILALKKEKSKTGMARLMQLAATKKPLIIGAVSSRHSRRGRFCAAVS